MSFSSYTIQEKDTGEDVRLDMFHDVENSLRLAPNDLTLTLDDDMKVFSESLEGGHFLFSVWNEFNLKIRSVLPVYIFYHLLKSLEKLQKKSRNDIVKQLSVVVKYKIPNSFVDGRVVYTLTSMTLFHPMCLDVSLKVLTDYLTCTNQLPTLNHLPRATLYYKLIDELANQSCSIFVPMYVFSKAYTTYMESTQFYRHFTPPLSFQELKLYLVRHSKQDVYSSKFNRSVEHELSLSILAYRPLLEPFHEQDLLDTYQSKMDIQFNPQQIDCIVSTVSSPITLIQGSAGTGKSTIVTAITDILIYRKETVIFLTISTKARDVLRQKLHDYKSQYGETVLVQAHTIAHFICAPFKRWDNILVDESSMIGNSQCIRFLNAFKRRLILVGDSKQVLPVQQIGTPFICLQSARESMNVCTLTLVQRQSQDNPILNLVQTLMDKNPIVLSEYTGQTVGVFYKTVATEQQHAQFYITFYGQNMCCIKPAYYMATSKCIHAELCKDKLPLVDKPEKRYTNDFLMRTKNETFIVKYNGAKLTFDVPNGSYCKIVGWNKKHIEIEYNDVFVGNRLFHESVLPRDIFSDFQLAYCQSTHKFQGSEYDTVLFNLNNNPFLLKEGGKNIFYTSITRAKKLLIICGTVQDKMLLSKISANEFATPIHDLFQPFTSQVCPERFLHTLSYEFVPLYKSVKYTCECGSELNHSSFSSHVKSKKHQAFLCAK